MSPYRRRRHTLSTFLVVAAVGLLANWNYRRSDVNNIHQENQYLNTRERTTSHQDANDLPMSNMTADDTGDERFTNVSPRLQGSSRLNESPAGLLESSWLNVSQGLLESSTLNVSTGLLESSRLNVSAGLLESSRLNDSQGLLESSKLNVSPGLLGSSRLNVSSGLLASSRLNESAGLPESSRQLESSTLNVNPGLPESSRLNVSQGLPVSSRLGCGARDVDDWQTVIYNSSYVYSAHLTTYTGLQQKVQLVASVDRHTCDQLNSDHVTDQLYCDFYLRQEDGRYTSTLVPVSHCEKIRYLNDDRFGDGVLHCSLNVTVKELEGSMVSLLHENQRGQAAVTNCMQLRQNILRPLTYTYSLCVGGSVRGYSDVSWFIKWVEMNRILGAEMIHMYNVSMSHVLDAAIEYYRGLGVLEVHQWSRTLAYDLPKSLWPPYLQYSLLRDCYLRTKRFSKFLVVHDLDEIIIPRHPGDMSWSEMIQRSSRNCNMTIDDVSTFGARHMMFASTYSPIAPATGFRTRRSVYTSNYRMRSKYIINTFLGAALRIHVVNSNSSTCIVDPSVGAVHHFRSKPLMMYLDHVRGYDQTMADNTTDKYNYLVEEHVTSALNAIDDGMKATI